MYEYLRGKIIEINSNYIIIDVGNIGYKLLTPNPYAFEKDSLNIVFTYFHVREDIQDLYGFKNKKERTLFLQLLTVNGIGPKSALAIVATGDLKGLTDAIELEDVDYLTKFPKVGPKGAKKIIIELKGKLGSVGELPSTNKVENIPLKEAMLALKALGYKDSEVKRVRRKLMLEDFTTDQYIKEGLRFLTKR